ncbi:MAG: hypothetical protein KI792_05010 [Alphaproteobacteria bacterium]|nr:hypothetical protein [Alphaproteobacteria bacterium SS10]
MVSNTPAHAKIEPLPGGSDDQRSRRMRQGAQGIMAAVAAAPVGGAVSAEEAAFEIFTGPQATAAQFEPILVQAQTTGPGAVAAAEEPEEVERPSVGATGSAYITIARNNTGSMSNDEELVGAVMVLLPDDAHAVAVDVPRPGALPECPDDAQCFTPLGYVQHVQARVAELGQMTAAFMRPIEAALGQTEGPSALLERDKFGENSIADFGTARRWFEQTMINAERGLEAEAFAASVDASQLQAIQQMQEEIGVELQMLGVLRGGIHQLQFQLDAGMLVPEGRMPAPQPEGDPIRLESGPESEHATQVREASLREEPAAPAPVATHRRTMAA